jgi:hypothetical protein
MTHWDEENKTAKTDSLDAELLTYIDHALSSLRLPHLPHVHDPDGLERLDEILSRVTTKLRSVHALRQYLESLPTEVRAKPFPRSTTPRPVGRP